MSRVVLLCALVPTLLALAASLCLLADYWYGVPEDAVASYVGRASCIECHKQQGEHWHGSHHDRAMDRATSETVLGNFDDQEFIYAGTRSKMYRRDDKFYITTDNAAGKLEEFEIKYVFGFTPLQQYMVEMPDDVQRAEGEIGRVQVLQIAWDIAAKRWFHLQPDGLAVAGDRLHWTGPHYNWNQTCADCHSTNLQRNFDVATQSYRTTFSEIDVSCEACHGPGSIHVELAEANSPFWDRRRGYGLTVNLKDNSDATMQLETCARCHSRRTRTIHPDYHPGHRYWDHYGLALLQEGLYYPDGQIMDEVFVFGSFLQSRMYHEGVRCTDCHDPHTVGRRRDETTGLPLTGNSLCTRCHTVGKYDTPVHHHHTEKKGVVLDGTRCVDCHMPERTYMEVDPRRDHSLRVPRPDLTVNLGTPNACATCHQEKSQTAQWAADRIVDWYGPKRAGDPHYGPVLAAAREARPSARRDLIALTKHRKTPFLVRASAVSLLARYGDPAARVAVIDALTDQQPLVRATAVETLAQNPWDLGRIPPHVYPQTTHEALVPLLDDPSRLVRIEAARALSMFPSEQFSRDGYGRFREVLAEYIAGLQADGDRGISHTMLGQLYANLGRRDDAVAAYRTAIEVQPGIIGTRDELAKYYDADGRGDDATRLREEEIVLIARELKNARNNAVLQFEHGRLLYNVGRYSDAERSFLAAVELEPRADRFLALLAMAYQKMQRWDEALRRAEQALELQPGNVDYRQLYQNIRKRVQN